MTTTTDRTPTEPEGMRGLLTRLSTLALASVILDKTRLALDAMLTSDATGPDLRTQLARSRGLFVAADVFPGALIAGGACSGVFMARTPDGRDWNGPSFHVLGGAALDRPLRRSPSTLVLMAMTDHGLSAFLSDSAAARSGDLLGLVLSEKGCSRLSLDGAVVSACNGLNRAAYSRDVTPTDIIRGVVRSPGSAALTQILTRAAAPATSGASRDARSSAESRGRAARLWRSGAVLPSTGGGRIG